MHASKRIDIPKPCKLIVNNKRGEKVVSMAIMPTSKTEVLEATIRGAFGRPTTDVSPMLFKVSSDAEDVVPICDVVGAVATFLKENNASGFGGMSEGVDMLNKTVTLMAIMRKPTQGGMSLSTGVSPMDISRGTSQSGGISASRLR